MYKIHRTVSLEHPTEVGQRVKTMGVVGVVYPFIGYIEQI